MTTLKEPFRVEGKKTMGYEAVEQLGWKVPDGIIYPTGGGVGLIGMWKAFDEMEALGWIGKQRPKMVTVQASGWPGTAGPPAAAVSARSAVPSGAAAAGTAAVRLARRATTAAARTSTQYSLIPASWTISL